MESQQINLNPESESKPAWMDNERDFPKSLKVLPNSNVVFEFMDNARQWENKIEKKHYHVFTVKLLDGQVRSWYLNDAMFPKSKRS